MTVKDGIIRRNELCPMPGAWQSYSEKKPELALSRCDKMVAARFSYWSAKADSILKNMAAVTAYSMADNNIKINMVGA
jgi:hypothetical protein